jgi:hypothetical protein
VDDIAAVDYVGSRGFESHLKRAAQKRKFVKFTIAVANRIQT